MKSGIRNFLKPIFFSLLNERSYRFLQFLSKRRDILNGVDDEEEMALLPLLIREGESVIDIGANYALYTYHLSKRVGPKGKVYAFEPIPFACQVCTMLVRHFRLNNVQVYQKGCGQENGTVAFTVPLQSFGAVSAGQSHMATRCNDLRGKEQHFKFRQWKTIDCEMVRVDDFLPSLESLSFIKADIEGAEYHALRGAEALIRRHHPTVLCEINPFFLEGFQIRSDTLIRFFTEKGYGFYRYHTRERPVLEEVSLEAIEEDNYLFVHPERLDRVRQLLDTRATEKAVS